MSQKWWQKGLRFQCQGSGNCCLSRGEYGFVYLSKGDKKALAKHLDMDEIDFLKKYCDQSDGIHHLKERAEQDECMFLKENKCSVYSARPTQCRTWPFWPENMNAKSWKKDVKTFCPGVGRGPHVPAHKIEMDLTTQALCDKELGL